MSEFKGTKGKWYHENGKSVSIFHPKIIGERICTVIISGFEPTEEDFYNALLISKAPEMLEMLIEICNSTKNEMDYKLTKAEELIKKATEL